MEQALRELGCRVYNPNVQLKREGYTNTEASDIWLDRFTEELTKGQHGKGFVLQIQTGDRRERSHMQVGEQRIAEAMGLPIMGIMIESFIVKSGYTVEQLHANEQIIEIKFAAWSAIQAAREQLSPTGRAEFHSPEFH